MKVKKLDTIDFKTLMECFFEAFENYFVKMPKDLDYFEKRFFLANVRYDLSFGMFDNEKLIGFIINGIDQRNGENIAYNTGTGVIPSYRGKNIIKKIYDFAIPVLKENKVTKCELEVIKNNLIAIKSYESIGFNIKRNLKCFSGEILLDTGKKNNLKKITHNDLDWENLNNQEYYTWDNHKNSIKRGNYDYYQVLNSTIIESYFIINSENGYIAQFDSFSDSLDSWNRLFSVIKLINSNVKINNVDEILGKRISYLESIGLKNSIDQFVMEMKL